MTTAILGAACRFSHVEALISVLKKDAVFGTGALPFIVGATLAFGGSVVMYYRSCLGQALLALQNYPHLLQLHLDANYPTHRWDKARVTAFLDGRGCGWVEKSMLVTAWQSAGPALDVSNYP